MVVNDIGVSHDVARYAALTGDAAEFGKDAYSEDAADRVADEIRRGGGVADASREDISDPAAASHLVRRTLDNFGRVDILVNSAGIVIHDDFGSLRHEDLLAALGVHLFGSFHVAKAAWPAMVARGYGRILNVGSVAGVLVGVPGHAVYDAAKGALVGLTLSLAAEGGPCGIQVNCLMPSANTRCSLSVQRAYGRPPGLTADVVAPAACWLVHEECPAQGRLYMAGGGRMARVYSAIADGYQSPDPAAFSVESIREHWMEIDELQPGFVPPDAAALSARSSAIYRRTAGENQEES